jgi:hypothetical protein
MRGGEGGVREAVREGVQGRVLLPAEGVRWLGNCWIRRGISLTGKGIVSGFQSISLVTQPSETWTGVRSEQHDVCKHEPCVTDAAFHVFPFSIAEQDIAIKGAEKE